MKDEINKLLEPLLGATVKSTYSTGGGSINQTQVLELTNGERVFMKHNSNPPTDFFLAEVKGLRLLAQAENGPRIPKPIALQSGSRPTFLIMEYLENSSESKNFSDRLARALAELHRISQDHFGLDHDNFIGSTPQKNDLEKDGIVFFRDQRIEFQRQLARKAGLLPAAIDKKIDSLCENLNRYMDTTGEKPALMHGDLWSGNYFPDSKGNPCIFDPAVYYGLREADIAMTELFGRLPQRFYDAYHEAFPMNPGYPERKDLYNLYHLLNHLNLFGGSYLSSVQQAVNRYAH
ncbi:MAG: fructosamine kinase family protein [Nitrospinae bacterium]|nr:fructosamine kinase family protein [Nitrospinota bacterium]MZH04737.1 fructosamine kinase family protein [Nitrospinota bacterium]MZH14565.1 fructosamine kinase family protein [Nitrospinota bacterium]